MAHDPQVYKDPWLFNPDRFLPKESQAVDIDPRKYVFGFGRRFVSRLVSCMFLFDK